MGFSKKVKTSLLHIYDFFRYHKSYSQDGEDMLIKSFMEEYPKHYKGVYVDVGAHHPVRFSNTYFFYKKGWRGVNVDATPGSMNSFRWLRRNDINLEMGVGPENGTLTFYCFDEPALNTFSKETALERHQNTHYKIVKEVAVPVLALSEILNKHLQAPKIDFLTIDVEGLDFEVLQSNDWSKYKPTFVLVEDTDIKILNLQDSRTYRFLSGMGYELQGKNQKNVNLQAALKASHDQLVLTNLPEYFIALPSKIE